LRTSRSWGIQYLEAELAILSDLLKEIKSDDVFYDIGADAGLYTVFVATKVPHVRLISFEPNPLRRESLQRNLEEIVSGLKSVPKLLVRNQEVLN
jgi:predicted RNA methylase